MPPRKGQKQKHKVLLDSFDFQSPPQESESDNPTASPIDTEWDGTEYTEVEGLFWTWKEAQEDAWIELRALGYDDETDLDLDVEEDVIDDEEEQFHVTIEGDEEVFKWYITKDQIRTPTVEIGVLK
ncbi:uncharacterized protein I303_101644 [Kwoniella dejecticola CBS 10117]|uniref:Uncharacterized protein n=1 Tax=Kwoniella dejecticola CBS 10117 TaxID=1296121 RepID=A0A1A6AD75_9TREE|nr:uncharacterized protein I303_02220 [Kwoniella dejecticola CBS 10117]OBR88004.1 hypothetical protein I303_02220 [Kwoniella dejecticola CBS 10117]